MTQDKLLNYLQSLKQNISPVVQTPVYEIHHTQVKSKALNREDINDAIIKYKQIKIA